MPKTIIETVTFRLNDGVGREAFVGAAEAFNSWVRARPGFMHRRLSCTDDGVWIEHIQWQDMGAAKTAATEIGKAPGNMAFLSAIDGKTVQLMHSELEVAVN